MNACGVVGAREGMADQNRVGRSRVELPVCLKNKLMLVQRGATGKLKRRVEAHHLRRYDTNALRGQCGRHHLQAEHQTGGQPGRHGEVAKRNLQDVQRDEN